MSKMKRKWLRVMEYEETGRPLDETTRQSLLETHPDLPILHDDAAMPEQQQQHQLYQDGPQMGMPPPPATMMQAPEALMQTHLGVRQEMPIEPQIDSQLEQQIQREIATADPPRG